MNRMKIPSVKISPRVQCAKTAGKTRVSVTQLNSKLHCRDFVRMVPVSFWRLVVVVVMMVLVVAVVVVGVW